jgi:hypothetical protein
VPASPITCFAQTRFDIGENPRSIPSQMPVAVNGRVLESAYFLQQLLRWQHSGNKYPAAAGAEVHCNVERIFYFIAHQTIPADT